MIEDEDDKVRRNLVGFSAAVIGLAALGIQYDAVIKKLLDQQPAAPASSLLALSLSVLVYLLARYRFSKAYSEEAQGEHVSTLARFQHSYALRIWRWYVRHFRWRASLLVTPAALESMEDRTKEVRAEIPELGERVPDVDFELRRPEENDDPLLVRYHWSLFWEKSENVIEHVATGRPGRFRPNVAQRTVVRIVSGVRTVTYTKVALEIHAPVFLAAIALTTLVWKVAAGYVGA